MSKTRQSTPAETKPAAWSAGSAPPKEGRELVTVAPEPAPVAKRSRSRSGSQLNVSYGKQKMRAYPMTEEQIENLSHLGYMATGSYSLGAGFIGFAIDLRKDLQLATGVDPDTVTYWSGLNTGAFIVGAALFAIGTYFLWKRGTKLTQIKNSTEFPDEE